jgi:hypothetical protein
MIKHLEQAMDSHLSGMDKQVDEGCVCYTGAVEIEGAAVGVSLMFFGETLCRFLVQLSEVPEAHSLEALRLCGRINEQALYKATLEQGLFALTLDVILSDDSQPERLMEALYMLLDGARLYHIAELKIFLGHLSSTLPPPTTEV